MIQQLGLLQKQSALKRKKRLRYQRFNNGEKFVKSRLCNVDLIRENSDLGHNMICTISQR